ncbi:hypothetical protein ACS0TY_008207 [Phlomoides rotata]
MAGISLGPSHPRPCSGKKMLRRRKYNEEAADVILIDVDSENFDDVIIIDIPESLPPKKNEGSSMLRKDNWPFRNVINIDDDDDDDVDDEIPESSHFVGFDNNSFSAGTSSSRESICVDEKDSADAAAAAEDCQFVQDKATPVRLSKCKRTYSGNFFRRNRYGLDTDSECDSSDNDYPDCELVEDISGKVQEQWEKAFSRRGKDINNVHTGARGYDGNYHQNAKSKDGTRQHKEASGSFSDKSIDEIDAEAFYRKKEDTDFGCTRSSDDTIHDQQNDKYAACGRSNLPAEFHPSVHVEQADCLDCEPGNSCCNIDGGRKDPSTCNFASREESTKKFDQPIPSKPDLSVEDDSCIGKFGPIESEATICKSKSSFECGINQGISFPKDNHGNVQETPTRIVEEREHLGYKQSHATGGAKEMDNLMPERCSFNRSKLPDKQTDLSSTPSCDAVDVSGKSPFPKNVMLSVQGKEGNHKETRPQVPEIPLYKRNHVTETKLQEDDSMSNIQQQENKDDLPSQNGDTQETCIISEREKLKETDEYKRAVEEEWASRQQALQIQSEEARRLRQLRKRRRLESMRLLDMERRQKERIEEVRNIQKKDEENMNLKETIRGEVRNELKKLETKCKDMAPLLHMLGIQVGSWPHPSPQEVQTAYKRAMLTFHPDRAPQFDIRKQVEAEEKFKLVNRIKEKLCLQGKWVVT